MTVNSADLLPWQSTSTHRANAYRSFPLSFTTLRYSSPYFAQHHLLHGLLNSEVCIKTMMEFQLGGVTLSHIASHSADDPIRLVQPPGYLPDPSYFFFQWRRSPCLPHLEHCSIRAGPSQIDINIFVNPLYGFLKRLGA